MFDLDTSNIIENEEFFISNGSLVIDEPVFFSNCLFTFKDGSSGFEISNPEGIVKIENCKFQSFENKLWKGINISPNAENVIIKNCEINDAIYGVNIGSKGITVVESNKFNRNLYGIITFIQYEGEINNLALRNNYFNCTSPLKYSEKQSKPDYTGKYYKQSYIAIALNNTNLLSRNKIGGGCDFSYVKNHSNGIVIKNGHLDISNYIFENIRRNEQDYYDNPTEGNAIAVNKLLDLDEEGGNSSDIVNYIKVEGFQTAGKNAPPFPTMKNVDRGIYNMKGSLNVSKLNIENADYGIHSQGAQVSSKIRNNLMKDIKNRGVYLFDYNAGEVTIDNNKIITMESYAPGAIGIEMVELYTSNWTWPIRGKRVDIANNVIEIDDGRAGMHLSGIQEAYINRNIINLNHYNNGNYDSGILLSGGARNRFYLNGVMGKPGYTGSDYSGIKILGSPGTDFQCNSIVNVPRSLEIWGNCENTNINNFIFKEYITGVFHREGSVTGDQMYQYNHWSTSHPATKKYNVFDGNKLIDGLIVTYVVYEDDIGTHRDPAPCFPIIVAKYEGYGDYIKCVSQPFTSIRDTTLTELDRLIAVDSAITSSHTAEQQWQQDFYLYSKIKDYNISNNLSTAFSDFYTGCLSNAISEYYTADSLLRAAMNFSQFSVLNDTLSSIGDYMTSIAYYDSLYFNQDISYLSYISQREALLEKVNNATEQGNEILNSYVEQRTQRLQNTVIPVINTLSTPTTASDNYKQALKMEALFHLRNLSYSDSLFILSTAQSPCLELNQNGILRLQALSILLGAEPSIEANCSTSTPRSIENADGGLWQIYPNPVSSGVLHVKAEEIASGKLWLFNLQGTPVYTTEFKEQTQLNIHLSDELSGGVYFLKIESEHGNLTEKIIIH